MSSINFCDIQSDPDGFLRRIEAGELLVVLRGEEPVAEVKPILPASAAARPFGLCAGAFVVPADFDDPLPAEVLQEFEGERHFSQPRSGAIV